MIEVGANIGTETISFSKICKRIVFAFEPLSENFKILCQLKKDNSFENLYLKNVLVSDFNGKADFKTPAKNNSGTGYLVKSNDVNSGEYEVVTLDANLNLLTSCAVIIIDVEGFELNVIRGAKGIIQRFQPYIIIEVNPNYIKKRSKSSVFILYEEITNLGYTFYNIDKFRIMEIDMNSYNANSNKNWICIPDGKKRTKNKLSNTIFFNALNPLINYKIL